MVSMMGGRMACYDKKRESGLVYGKRRGFDGIADPKE